MHKCFDQIIISTKPSIKCYYTIVCVRIDLIRFESVRYAATQLNSSRLYDLSVPSIQFVSVRFDTTRLLSITIVNRLEPTQHDSTRFGDQFGRLGLESILFVSIYLSRTYLNRTAPYFHRFVASIRFNSFRHAFYIWSHCFRSRRPQSTKYWTPPSFIHAGSKRLADSRFC